MGRNRRHRYRGPARAAFDLFVADEIRILDLRSLDLQIRLVCEITSALILVPLFESSLTDGRQSEVPTGKNA
jgi:hypothetical protein